MRTPIFDTRWLAALFLIAVAGAAAWSAWSGTSPGELALVPCPVYATTGVTCPGCGMTRACVALARGELAGAWHYQPFAFLLVPLAALVVLWPRRTYAAWGRLPRPLRSGATGLALATCLGLWVARLV